MNIDFKNIQQRVNNKTCSVCGTRCKYWYNDLFELKKTMCNGFKLALFYKIILIFINWREK